MSRQAVKDALGWGVALWLIGYVLGMLLFAAVPVSLIGWIIMPIGAALALWVAFSKVKGDTLAYYGGVAVAWTLVAVIGDYIFIVKMLNPPDGYYKLDVYIYYAVTLAIPLAAGWARTQRVGRRSAS